MDTSSSRAGEAGASIEGSKIRDPDHLRDGSKAVGMLSYSPSWLIPPRCVLTTRSWLASLITVAALLDTGEEQAKPFLFAN